MENNYHEDLLFLQLSLEQEIDFINKELISMEYSPYVDDHDINLLSPPKLAGSLDE